LARDLIVRWTPVTDDALLALLAASIAVIVLLAYPGYQMLVNLIRAVALAVGRMVGK
jgi:hypothetical protein